MHLRERQNQFTPKDVFVGYHNDAPASVILRLAEDRKTTDGETLERAKAIFLQCATPDAVSRLEETNLTVEEREKVASTFYELRLASLADAVNNYSPVHSLIQVTILHNEIVVR